ncbi:hypothetical protein EXIGLDRAFT_622821 [Exidia glandulosa HHB12029]|uniref:Uncharacterized protein n=1 Tax=Exidia glandulosa HHB12029 TaxID=1314781 RepID=A0A165DY45_EXIGL|nr:hypothetical protein EXIGLDRAFT_622821 [Exidia glandulosa HHB12029]
MISPYAPNETATTIFLEQTFIAEDVVTGTGYGIQLMLYLGCARFLWSQRGIGKLQPMLLLAYITVLVLVETVFVAVQARTIQGTLSLQYNLRQYTDGPSHVADMYVDNRNYPGGPWQYFLATQYLPENVLFIATLFTATFLSDALVLWRCWVIWSASGSRLIACLVVAFPIICLVASFVVGVLWARESSKPGLSLYSELPINLGTSYYALSLGVNVFLTFLIAARLIFYRRRVSAALPSDDGRSYVSLATIFVESAALYSVCAFLFLVTYAIQSPMNQVFLGMTNTGQQIATYLIIYRVAEGHDFGRRTLQSNGRSRRWESHSITPATHIPLTLTRTDRATREGSLTHEAMMDLK